MGSSALVAFRFARACRQAVAVLALTAAAFLLMHAVLFAPSPILLRIAHRLPAWVDAPSIFYVAHAALLVALLCVLRVPARVWVRGAPLSGWFQATASLTAGSVLLSTLVTLSLLSDPSSVAPQPYTALVAQLTAQFPVTGLAGRLVAEVVLGPFSEELLFRALLLGVLFSRTSRWLGLGITSALFASVHSGPFIAGFAGVAYGLLYLRYRSILICVIAHALNNFLAAGLVTLSLAYLREESQIWPSEDSLVWLQVLLLFGSLSSYFMFFKLVSRDINVRNWLRARPAEESSRP